MTISKARAAFLCSFSSAVAVSSFLPAWAQVFNESTNQPRFRRNEIKLTDEAPRRTIGAPTLKDVFPTMALNMSQPQPTSVEGMKLDGIGPKAGKILGFNHFVVVQGTPVDTMASVYKDNRESKKSNFITVDPFVHAYFAFNNAIALKVIEDTLYGELAALLHDLMQSCVKDYRACDIDEVKDDIQRNLAFVIVGLKLLDPKVVLPDMGGASDLAKIELATIAKGKRGKSVIFNREDDFSAIRPIGFYLRSEKGANYYRAASWLSRMYLTLSDVTNNSETGGGNNFRRALLLYRALEIGKANRTSDSRVDTSKLEAKPVAPEANSLMPRWQRIYDISTAISPSALTREQTVYPRDVRSMFEVGKLDFKNLLQTLAQPLSRARLLLTIKKQRPQGLDAASIFEMDKARGVAENMMVMRFMPPVNSYELEWLKLQTANYKEEGDEGAVNPLSLFVLYAWGSPVASNILGNASDHLNAELMVTAPELTRVAGRRRVEADPHNPVCQADKRWAVITEYFRPFKKNTQPALLSEAWAIQHLLSASGAFVDSFTAFDGPPVVAEKKPVTAGGAASSAATGNAGGDKPGTDAGNKDVKAAVEEKPEPVSAAARMFGPRQAVKRAANFHYLEPMPELYRKLSGFITLTMADLENLHCFPEAMKSRAADFIRLLDRLAKIADQELAVQNLTVTDFKLLANIDSILAAISSSTSNSIYLPALNPTTTQNNAASIGPGDPGLVYGIFSTDQGAFLSRGAVYTYYEVAGGPFKAEHWNRKKTFGFLRPPGWVNRFDVLSEVSKPDAGKTIPNAASSTTPPTTIEKGTVK